MDRARRFAVRKAAFTAAVLAVVSVPVAAQKPTPALPPVKAEATPIPSPSPSPVIVINNVPAPPVATKDPLLPAPIWAAIITLTGQSIIALLAWKQFQKNYEQKNREIKDRDDQVKLAEANKEKQFQLAEENRLTQFKLAEANREVQFKATEENKLAQFRSKELQDQFGDIQNRLASTEPSTRANAALRLAQFGETLKPGVGAGQPRNIENNPYFVPVVSQLSTTLYLEDNTAVRNAIREGVKNLITFAERESDEQVLLYGLIERLADVNKAARDGFIRAFAEWTMINNVSSG
jgi:hypothetical protein